MIGQFVGNRLCDLPYVLLLYSVLLSLIVSPQAFILKFQYLSTYPTFQLCFRVASRRVQISHDGLKLNGKHQLVVYVDDVNILGGSVHTVKEKAETLVVAGNETGL